MAILIAAAVVPRAVAETGAPESIAELHVAHERLDAEYRRELEQLVHVALARRWSELGDAAQGWRPAKPANGSLVSVAPDQYAADTADAIETEASAGDTQPWLERFAALRRQQADALFQLAKQAADTGQLSLAFQWATEAVRENPDHADARRVLGYEPHDGRWLTPFARRMVDAGKDWDSRFGWIVPDDTSREPKPSKDGWQVRTDNYLVTSNHSLEAAAELAARLERLHQVWRQLFAGFCFSEREVQQLFSGERQPRTRHRPFRVFYHRDKDSYVAALARRQPRIAETLGIYFDTIREAHFFAGADQDAGTLYHEAVHQLFQETRPAARQVGGTANFWIVEGVATYFETLREHRGPQAGLFFTIGDGSSGRLPAARRRLLEDGFYVPLAQLSQWGKRDLQARPELARLYSQSAGLAACLMDADRGRHREALVRYLQAVYAGRDDAHSLAKIANRSFDELDADYRRFMESLP